MNADEKELIRLYREMDTEEITTRVKSGNLIEIAQTIAVNELHRRKNIPAIPESAKYYCNYCKSLTSTAIMKGNGWIELVLYLFYLIPGIIYSVWRRSGSLNVCPICKTGSLIPAPLAIASATNVQLEQRDEKECPYCAERILAKAKVCKHCGNSLQP